MKAINKGFLEKVFPCDHIKYAFTMNHINRYKYLVCTITF